MIKSIEIQNFRTHKSSVLNNLSSGINAIIGTSGFGKTNIARCLNWIIKNTPLGFAFKSHFSDKKELTKGIINFDNGIVERRRGEKDNCYVLNEDEKNPLEALKTLPDEVKTICNLADYNIQNQHDQYFLLQNTSGEIARSFNDIVGLDIIDNLTKKLKGFISKSKDGIKNADADIERLEKEIKEFEYLDDIETDINKLEDLLSERDLLRAERKGLVLLIEEYDQIDKDIKNYEIYLKIKEPAQELIELAEQTRLDEREIEAIQSQIDAIETIDEEIKEIDFELEYKDMIFNTIEEIRIYKKEKIEIDELNEIIDTIKNIDDDVEYMNAKIKKMKKVMKEEFDICPYCGSQL